MLKGAAGKMFKTAGRILRECPPKLYLDAVRGQGIHYASLGSIPPEVREILVTREDPRFYSHKGILPKSMFRAFRYTRGSEILQPQRDTAEKHVPRFQAQPAF